MMLSDIDSAYFKESWVDGTKIKRDPIFYERDFTIYVSNFTLFQLFITNILFCFPLLLETICATEPTSRGVEPQREVKTLLMVAYFAYL